MSAGLDDYRWLISDQARRPLAELAGEVVTTQLAAGLRKQFSPVQAHLLLEQGELRARAKAKFRRASEMFFTRTLLEQATDERIAQYKASRFPHGELAADLCCGIGGDLIGLALRGPAVAVDRDPVALLLAEANARLHGAESVQALEADVADLSLDATTLLHVDPDRRAEGSRATRLELFSPDPQVLARLLQPAPGAAMKLAPATVAPAEWVETAEREWIGSGGECRQQVAWFGSLAARPGQSVATIVDPPSGAPCTVVGSDEVAAPPVAPHLGLFLFEPHAAVLAAGLDHWLANEQALAGVAPRTAYWTGDRLVHHDAIACFQVMESLPLDERQVRAALRQRRIGRLEIKKRGVAVEPERLRGRLKLQGDESATLILYRDASGSKAVLARRLLPLPPVQQDGLAAGSR